MRLPIFIARRYFLSKQSQRAVNIISLVSVAGVLVGTAALIIVLSVFNGFEDLVIRLYDSFDPDIRIEAAHGKNFRTDSLPIRKLQELDGISKLIPVIEENALVRYNDRQLIVTIKGVGEGFAEHAGVDSMMVAGDFRLMEGDTDFAVAGSGVAYGLQLASTGSGVQLDVYAPRREATSLLKPEEA
ncbi:MAG: ABC transporter permease, partial [Bacteroidota bacterium]